MHKPVTVFSLALLLALAGCEKPINQHMREVHALRTDCLLNTCVSRMESRDKTLDFQNWCPVGKVKSTTCAVPVMYRSYRGTVTLSGLITAVHEHGTLIDVQWDSASADDVPFIGKLSEQ